MVTSTCSNMELLATLSIRVFRGVYSLEILLPPLLDRLIMSPMTAFKPLAAGKLVLRVGLLRIRSMVMAYSAVV